MIALARKNPFPWGTFERRLWNHDRTDLASKCERDGFEACDEHIEYFIQVASISEDDPEMPECPWPVFTEEGMAWIKGWNQRAEYDGWIDALYRSTKP